MRRARAYLESLVRESEDIDYKIRTLDGLRARLEGLAPRMSHDKGASGKTYGNDRTGAYTAAIIDLERELERRTAEFARRRAFVVETLVAMEDTRHSSLLHCRYVEGEPWKDVAASLGISKAWCYTLHVRALKEFENLFYN